MKNRPRPSLFQTVPHRAQRTRRCCVIALNLPRSVQRNISCVLSYLCAHNEVEPAAWCEAQKDVLWPLGHCVCFKTKIALSTRLYAQKVGKQHAYLRALCICVFASKDTLIELIIDTDSLTSSLVTRSLVLSSCLSSVQSMTVSMIKQHSPLNVSLFNHANTIDLFALLI